MTKSRDRRRKNIKRINEGKVKIVYRDRQINKIGHHTNPRLALKGFSKNGKLNQFNPKTGQSQSGIKVATVQDYFYTIYGNSDPDIFENAMSDDFETPAAEVFRQLIEDDELWPMDADSDAILTRFITLQILRSPEKRRVDLDIARHSLKNNVEYQEFTNKWWSDEVKEGELNTNHIDYWWNHLGPKLVHYIHSMRKILVIFPEDSLATSASPVIPVYKMEDIEPYVLLGRSYLDTSQPLFAYASFDFTKCAAFFYPFSRRLGLILLPPESKCRISSMYGTEKLSKMFNFLLGELSDDFHFHPDDTEYMKDFFSHRKIKSSLFQVQRLLKYLETEHG